MNHGSEDSSALERIEQEAAAWILRTDRGLTATEQDAFLEWLAADPRHGVEVARHRREWTRLDQLAQWRPEHGTRPNPDLLAPPLRRRIVRFLPAIAFAAAAAVAIAVWVLKIPEIDGGSAAAPAVAAISAAPNQRVLEDGTIVELNRDAVFSVQFTEAERRVTLERGEAHFAVTKDPAGRPFIVAVQGVDLRAVGTAFNVRVGEAAVEVLVTEGRVRLDTKREPVRTVDDVAPAPESPPAPILEARQRAVVPLAAATPVEPEIATLTAGEIERVLAWQHRVIDFTAAPLRDVVAEFNRRNVVQIVLIDAELAALRVSAKLRSDNIEGLVRYLEIGFNARAERRGDGEILLRAPR